MLPIVHTADRLFRHGNFRSDRTFQAMVVGEKDAPGAGNLVHSLGLADSTGDRTSHTPRDE